MSIQIDATSRSTGLADVGRRQQRVPDLSGLAGKLGVDVSELEASRRSGQTLADFAAAKGIAKDDLIAAVKEEMAAHRPDGAPELSDGQLTEMASGMVDGTRPAGPPPGGSVQLPSRAILDALEGMRTSDGASLADLLARLGERTAYGADGTATGGIASLGVDASV